MIISDLQKCLIKAQLQRGRNLAEFSRKSL
nr:MAG TPA: hypothetical protein [Caudoviricetes sp.]